MAGIAKIPVVWSGVTGLPGVSVFYSLGTDAVAAVAALNTWFGQIKTLVPSAVTFQTPSDGDIVDETTGTLLSDFTGASGSSITGTGGSGSYAAGVGFRVRWGTSGIENGRRVVGSTFIVPVLGSIYDTSGTIANASVSDVQGWSNTLVSAAVLRVWHRPSPGGSDGSAYPFMSASVPDKVATLRSRRT